MPVSSTRKKKKTSNQMPKANSLELNQSKNNNSNSVQQSYYQGIVPSPEMMEKYKLVSESLPERLVKLTEEEASHRRLIERRITNYHFVSQITGQVFALVAVGGIGYLSYVYMLNGNSSDGKTIAITVMIGLAAIFLGKRILNKNNPDN